ncbi:MAG: hypothetical protein RLZ98_605 [Pseudomonadota bacterium]|jgi:KDO2-lipid IV(A) lauroyltransferase
MWDNFGRVVAESLVIDRLAADPERVLFEDCQKLQEIMQRGRGVVFVGLHFGNWEVTVAPAVRLGLNPIGLYKPLKDANADAFLRDLRSSLYPSGLLEASPSSLRQLARHLRAGGSVCMLADHRELSGPSVPFFGRPAPSSALAARLHQKFDVPLVAARVERLDRVRFRVKIEEVTIGPDAGPEEARIVAVMAATQRIFERWITENPRQWIWFYNRW